jgi:hypothetical protein
MHEWEIFTQSGCTAQTLGYVWADEEAVALRIAFERYQIVPAAQQNLVAVPSLELIRLRASKDRQ